MGPVTSAANIAAEGGLPLLIFSLIISGVIIFVLASLLWWFTKERIHARHRLDEARERRLANGAETMQRLKLEIEQLHKTFLDALAQFISVPQFSEYRRGHEAEHNDIKKQMELIRESQYEMVSEIRGVGARVEGSLKSVSGLLSQLVEIKHE